MFTRSTCYSVQFGFLFFFRRAQCSNLSTEELKTFKEGDVYVGEDGKRYRVKKSMLAKGFVTGPHGIGDPEDRSLRKIEADVLIPNLMNRQIEKTECRPEYEDLVGCLRKEGGALGLRLCKGPLNIFNSCKLKMFNDTNFRQKITDEYLEERSNARRTGKTAKERELDKFRQWKKENPDATSKLG